MISPEIRRTCDRVLSSVSLGVDNVLPVLLFGQKYSLRDTLTSAKKFAAVKLEPLVAHPLIQHLHLEQFQDILQITDVHSNFKVFRHSELCGTRICNKWEHTCEVEHSGPRDGRVL